MKNIYLNINRLTVFLLLFVPLFSTAQSSRMSLANKHYDNMSYSLAKEAYLDVLDRTHDSMIVARKIANCFEQINDPKNVVSWLDFLKRNESITQSELLLLAMRQRDLKDYTTSTILFKEYAAKYGSNAEVNAMIMSNDNLIKLNKDSKNFILTNSDNVNSSSSEMGCNYIDENRVLLSSSKRKSWSPNNKDTWNGGHFYELYIAQVKNNDLVKMRRIKGAVNTKFHDGPASYDEKNNYVYFTRNNRIKSKTGKDETGKVRLKIYRGKLEGRKLKSIEELSINSDEYSTAHPAISNDGKTLYFSSDRPGGFGGADIYKVTINDDRTLGEVINMGDKINTSTDEYFPTMHSKDPLLYFASKGHRGLGGLDIFAAKISGKGSVSSIINLGAPINSSLDDFSFTNNQNQTFGYLISNRDGGKGNDDVYSFKQLKPIKTGPILEGVAKDLLTELKLSETKVYLTNNGKVLDSVVTDTTGFYSFTLDDVKSNFSVTGEKIEYNSDSREVVFNDNSEFYNQDLFLTPKFDYRLIGKVFDAESNDAISDVTISLIETNGSLKYDLSSDDIGEFRTGILTGKVFSDIINFDVVLEKDGYLTKRLSFEEKLDVEPEVYLNSLMSVVMDKIVVGETDLAKIYNLKPIYFDLSKSNIRPDAALELDKIYQVMIDNPEIKVQLGSHTDSRSSSSFNMALSNRRAKSSAAYLIKKGISKDRISGKGFGESKLLISDKVINALRTKDEKEEAHQKNRRTEFIVVK